MGDEMNKSVSDARADYEKKFLDIKREIFLLEQDFRIVKHPGTKRAIENQIHQKQGRLTLLMDGNKTHPEAAANKTLDK